MNESCPPLFALALEELQRDPLVAYLSAEQQQEYLAGALAIGREQGERFRGRSVKLLVEELGARYVVRCEKGAIAGSVVFAEYDSEARLITVYQPAIASVVCLLDISRQCGGAEGVALDLLLAHELFHHLEATQIVPAPFQLPPVSVPILGGLLKSPRRLRCTSEIAAHAFAHAVAG
jgi:hypothetical protein